MNKISGVASIPSTKGFVRYDRPQSLSDPQKTQALDNLGIAAALAGYAVVNGSNTFNGNQTVVGTLTADALKVANPSGLGPSPYLSAVNSFSEATLELRNSQTNGYTKLNLGSLVANGNVTVSNAGSSTTPSLTLNDGTTGFWRPAANQLGITAQGVDTFRFTNGLVYCFAGTFHTYGGIRLGGASGDIQLVRNATGPTLETRAAGGLKVCNADGSAVAAVQCGKLRSDAAIVGGNGAQGANGPSVEMFYSNYGFGVNSNGEPVTIINGTVRNRLGASIVVGSGGSFGFSSAAHAGVDTASAANINYASAGVLQVGTTSNNALGSLNLANLTASGNLTAGLGTFKAPTTIALDVRDTNNIQVGRVQTSGAFVTLQAGSSGYPVRLYGNSSGIRIGDGTYTVDLKPVGSNSVLGLYAGQGNTAASGALADLNLANLTASGTGAFSGLVSGSGIEARGANYYRFDTNGNDGRIRNISSGATNLTFDSSGVVSTGTTGTRGLRIANAVTATTFAEVNPDKVVVQGDILKMWGYSSSFMALAQTHPAGVPGAGLDSPGLKFVGAWNDSGIEYSPAASVLFRPSGLQSGSLIFASAGYEGLRITKTDNRPSVLQVNSPTISTAMVNVTTSWTGKKGLLLQGVSGQTENLLEAQDNMNAVLASIGPTGVLTASGNIMPTVHNTSDLGTSAVRFRTGYFGTGVTAAGQSNFATVNTANLVTSGTVTFNRATAASYGVYAQGVNASGYVDWELNEGVTAGTSGGTLTLRAGDLANTGNVRLRYNGGYPGISTTASSFTIATSGHSQIWASTYITQGIGGNVYYNAQSAGSYANLFRNYTASQATLVARGTTSQTGSLIEAQGNAGAAVFSVSPSGNSILNNGVLQGGLVLRQFEASDGGWSNFEIAGPNFSLGTGLQFVNHVSEIRAASTFRALGNFGASVGVFGDTGNPTASEDSIRLMTSGGVAYIYTMRYASSPYPSMQLSGSSIVLRTGAGAWPAGSGWGTAALSIDASQNTTLAGRLTTGGVVTSPFRSLSADPTTLDIASGLSQLVKNTTSSEIRHWANDGGVMKKSPAFT